MAIDSKATDAGRSWREVVALYCHWPVIALFLLGFSSGLPFMLVGGTLIARLADVGVKTATIGFFSWISLSYSIKVFWAPVIDQLRLPILHRLLGQRRSWLLLAQSCIILGLWQMARLSAADQTMDLALWGLLVAFASATQDISIDAYRIEIVGEELQGALASSYVFGYRVAILAAGAGALYMAQYMSWHVAYGAMVGLMLIGFVTTLVMREPTINHRRIAESMASAIEQRLQRHQHMRGWLVRFEAWFAVVVVGPFQDFLGRYGRYSVPILLLVGLFAVCDIVSGSMSNAFYLNYMGFTKAELATVTKIFGFAMAVTGSLAGGVLVTRFGIRRMLVAGALSTALANLMFVVIAQFPANLYSLAVAVTLESFAGGMATVAFVAWLSSMTSAAFTATQYALFSSLMTLPGKFFSGFSGLIIQAWDYPHFFMLSSLMGLPAVALAVFMVRHGDTLDALASPTHDQEVVEERGGGTG